MVANKSSSELGPVNVVTTSNRGHSAEEMADMALNKIMMVSEKRSSCHTRSSHSIQKEVERDTDFLYE